MGNWNLLAKIAGGGFGLTVLVLVILSLVAWAVGLVIQKAGRKGKENSSKGNK